MAKRDGPRILLFDIETAPILAYVWSIWDQNVGLNQIKSDWHLLAWSAKWLDEKKTIYMDQRNAKKIDDDKEILDGLWKLLDEADIVITQNGKQFDSKKTNARFIMNGMPPPSPYKHIDTKQLAKRHFGFTSNKLEYMADKLCKTKKMTKRKFEGFSLWSECLAGNIKAWNEMKKYNIQDVLALEELYKKIAPWGTGIDFNPYRSIEKYLCNCGSDRLHFRGPYIKVSAKFRKFQCQDCGKWGNTSGASNNLLSEAKRLSLKGPLTK